MLGMAIQARPASTRPGPTLMGCILPGPIMGLKEKTWSGFGSGPDFGKKPGSNPTRPDPFKLKRKLLKYYIYIYIYFTYSKP